MSAATAGASAPIEMRPAPRRPRGNPWTVARIVGLAFFCAWSIFPFLWILSTSLKPNREIYRRVTIIPEQIIGDHFVEVLTGTSFLTWFRNSLFVALGTTALAMATALLAAYALTRLSFRGRTFLARASIVTYLIPPSLLFIPLFQVAFQFNLSNRAAGLVIIYLIFSVPFATWLAISYFNTIPSDLEDAALVDGATRLQALRTVFIPLALPALAVIALYTFTLSWNEFLFALLLISRDSQKTIPVGLAEFVVGDVFAWGPLMAGSLIALLPPVIIYVAAQRWVISGLAGGAIKG